MTFPCNFSREKACEAIERIPKQVFVTIYFGIIEIECVNDSDSRKNELLRVGTEIIKPVSKEKNK